MLEAGPKHFCTAALLLCLLPLQLFLSTLHVLLGNQSSRYFYGTLIHRAQVQYCSKTRFPSPSRELSQQGRRGPQSPVRAGDENCTDIQLFGSGDLENEGPSHAARVGGSYFPTKEDKHQAPRARLHKSEQEAALHATEHEPRGFLQVPGEMMQLRFFEQ